MLIADTPGIATVTANYNGLTATKDIKILASPSELVVPTKSVSVSAGGMADFWVRGKDNNGFSGVITNDRVEWSSQNGLSKFENGKIIGLSAGSDVLTFRYQNAVVNVSVTVNGSSQSNGISDNFEVKNGAYSAYPSGVKGWYDISGEHYNTGTKSGKLTFDFNDEIDALRAVYLDFSTPKQLPYGAQKIGLWVYSDKPLSHAVKAQLYNADGEAVRITFADTVDWTGWKYLEAAIPQDIKMPATLSKLYIVQNDKTVKDSGAIYFDDLSVITGGGGSTDGIVPVSPGTLPADTTITDPFNTTPQENPNALSFSVFGQPKKASTLLDLLIGRKLYTRLNDEADLSVFLGNTSSSILSGITNQTLVTGDYASTLQNGNTFINMNNMQGGILKTGTSQWNWFLNDLNNLSTKNVFIFLPKPVDETGFTDSDELALFKQTVEQAAASGKNVFVITGGGYTVFNMENGVRYYMVPDIPSLSQSEIATGIYDIRYLLFSIDGDTVTYQIKSLF